MKKLISLALAVFMIISLSTAAFAETATAPGANTADVKGSYVEGYDGNGIVYSVNIEWEGLDFTYHAEKGAVWDPNTLTYDEIEPAYWDGEGKITVTNRSNTKILAVPEYAANAGYEDATMTFDPAELRVASAESGTEQTGTITVTPGGSLPAMDGEETIGTITLTISQDTDVTVEEAEALIDKAYALLESAKMNGVYDGNKDEFDAMSYTAGVLTTIISASNGDDQSGINNNYTGLLNQYNICLELMQ